MEKEKIKVVIFGDHPEGRTGYGRLIKNIATELHESGNFEIIVIGINYGDVNSKDYYKHITEYSSYEANTIEGDPQSIGTCFAFLNKCDFDVLITVNDIWQLWQFPSYLNQLKARGRDFIWIPWFPVDQKVRQDWLQVINASNYPAVMSKYGYEQLKDSIKNLSYVKGWFDSSDFYEFDTEKKADIKQRFIKNFSLPEDSFIFGFVGKNQSRKNIFELIKAFNTFIEQSGATNCFLYLHTEDSGWGGSVSTYIQERGIKPVLIKQPGYFPSNSKMNELYNILDCLVVPSLSEGLCMPIFEAQLTGTPVIGADNTSISEALSEGAGILVKSDENVIKDLKVLAMGTGVITELPSFNAKMMVSAMSIMYHSEKDRERVARKGKESAIRYINDKFSWVNFISNSFSEYKTKKEIKKLEQKKVVIDRTGWVKEVPVRSKLVDVLMICPTYGLQCGIGEYTKELVAELTESGVEVEMFVSNSTESLKQQLKAKKYRATHIQHEFSFFPNQNALIDVLRDFDGKKILTLHTLPSPVDTIKPLTDVLSSVIVHSEEWKEHVNKSVFIPIACSRFSGNPMERKLLRRKIGLSEEDIVIGSSGFLRRQKGFEILIDAIKLLNETVENGSFKALILAPEHFTGWQYEESFFSYIESNKMSDKVIVLRNYFDKSEMLKFLNCSDMVAYPYNNENMVGGGCSASIKSVIGLRKPIIVTDCSSFTDMGNEIYKIAPYPGEVKIDHKQLAKAIIDVGSNKDVQTFLLQKSIERVERDTIEAVVEQHKKIYNF